MAFDVRWLDWRKAWRVVPSRYPPIDLFERISDNPADWDLLAEIESATNPRIRDRIGEICLVPAQERVSGPGASWVMAPFTHLNPRGSRFSDGSYGVYYAASRIGTAILETVFHMSRIYADSRDPPHNEDMRVLTGTVTGDFVDLTRDRDAAAPYLDPDSYAESQVFGRAERDRGLHGIVYPSVRDPYRPCIAAFRPKAVGRPVQERHLKYRWDGTRISRVFDYRDESWKQVDAYR